MNYEKDNMSVYVGTYHKYASGSIEGRWMRLSDYDSFEEFEEACRELHKDEDGPEFMCQDYEGLPKSKYRESGIDWLEEFFDLMDKDDDELDKIFEYWDEVYDGADADTILDRYFCESMSDSDFGYYLAHDLGCLEIPANLDPYFNYESYGRDCKYDFTETTSYIFSAN